MGGKYGGHSKVVNEQKRGGKRQSNLPLRDSGLLKALFERYAPELKLCCRDSLCRPIATFEIGLSNEYDIRKAKRNPFLQTRCPLFPTCLPL